jgi:thymidine phosphorylase
VEVPLPTLEVLERTRRGEPVATSDVSALMDAWATGAMSDAQMAAWCATAGLRGVPYDTSLAVVRSLLGSGDRLELARLGPVVDIRTTGGVGDSALILTASAIAAAGGAIVASTGSHSIAHVGGVLDAVSSLPGMRAGMPVADFVVQARDTGMVIAEPGERLVPDERRLARLRDATATAEGDALVAIAAAARGISGGAPTVALTVPAGAGGLLPDLAHAAAAAELVARLGAEWHRTVTAVPVVRDVPAGRAAGHALEMRAALRTLAGEGPAALADGAVKLAAAALGAAGLDGDPGRVRALLDKGRAAEAVERWVHAQGGPPGVVAHPDRIPTASVMRSVAVGRAGRITHVDSGAVGAAARWLGAGRLDPGQVIDPTVGVEVVAVPGDVVGAGEVAFVVHAADEWMAGRAVFMLGTAVGLAD